MSKISETNIIEIQQIFSIIKDERLIKVLKEIIKVADKVIEFQEYMGDDIYYSSSDNQSYEDSDDDYEPDNFEEEMIGQSNSLNL
tara:strand:- start:363 stop:617 length:255 start_codon:yes stop_codon:yes gene_type:complete